MATGIVSIALEDVGARPASLALLALAVAGYVLLAVLYFLRAVRHPRDMAADARNPASAFGYFTLVAGSAVVGVGLVHASWNAVGVVLTAVAALLWILLGYVLPWLVIVARRQGSVLGHVNGTWFVWSVASQSLAVALVAVHPLLPGWELGVGFLAVLSWSVGTMLYAGIALLVVLRLVHFGLKPAEFDPPYWVAMGALAISVVAGSGIVSLPSTPVVDAARGLIGGTVVIFWCFALWLIPLLLGAGLWRHALHRVPLRYTPALWSMVFPLGMFSHASMLLGRVERLRPIERIGEGFLWVALLAWILVAVGLVVSLLRHTRRRRPLS